MQERQSLATPVAELELGNRIQRRLGMMGVRTLGELCRLDRRRLLRLSGFGEKSVRRCASKLEGMGLRLGMTDAEIAAYASARRIYISGRMSGMRREEYVPLFGAAEATVREFLPGWEVFNPCQNGLPLDAPVGEHMRRDLTELARCRAIYMMDGWQRSAGCRTELMAAMAMGLDVYFQSSMGLPKGEESGGGDIPRHTGG